MQPSLAPPQPTLDRPAVCDSLVDLLAARVADARERPAVVDGLEPTRSWTWGEIAAAAVYWLADECGPISGQVVELEQHPFIGRNPPKTVATVPPPPVS
jgi:hypothetical protein